MGNSPTDGGGVMYNEPHGPPRGYVPNTNKTVRFGGPKNPNNITGDDGNGGVGDSNYNPNGMNVQTDNPNNKPNFKYITNFLSESQATEFREGERKDVGDPFGEKKFIGDASSILGDSTVLSGASPFAEGKRGRFLKGVGKGYASETPMDQVVEQQMGSAVPGGEPGVGQQGFGARALGGSDQVVENLPPPGAEQTETPVAQAQSDLQLDPNIPPLGPGQSVVPDVNYVLPTSGQQQIIAFSPNDPQAMYTARGPLSRNLTTARSGFGMKYL